MNEKLDKYVNHIFEKLLEYHDYHSLSTILGGVAGKGILGVVVTFIIAPYLIATATATATAAAAYVPFSAFLPFVVPGFKDTMIKAQQKALELPGIIKNMIPEQFYSSIASSLGRIINNMFEFDTNIREVLSSQREYTAKVSWITDYIRKKIMADKEQFYLKPDEAYAEILNKYMKTLYSKPIYNQIRSMSLERINNSTELPKDELDIIKDIINKMRMKKYKFKGDVFQYFPQQLISNYCGTYLFYQENIQLQEINLLWWWLNVPQDLRNNLYLGLSLPKKDKQEIINAFFKKYMSYKLLL